MILFRLEKDGDEYVEFFEMKPNQIKFLARRMTGLIQDGVTFRVFEQNGDVVGKQVASCCPSVDMCQVVGFTGQLETFNNTDAVAHLETYYLRD